MDYLGREIISSKFMQYFSQLEIAFKDNFKNRKKLALFIRILSTDDQEPNIADDHFREEDKEKFDFSSINSDEYFILFPKRIVRKNLDFDFYIE